MNKRIITDKATLELATAQAAKSIIDRIDTLEQELVDERYSKRKVQARHDDLAAELVEVRRLWSEATTSQCRISGNYDVLVVKNERLEAALTKIDENCTEYLSVGGLFNPELMEHEKVCRMVRLIADISGTALTDMRNVGAKRLTT